MLYYFLHDAQSTTKYAHFLVWGGIVCDNNNRPDSLPYVLGDVVTKFSFQILTFLKNLHINN